MFHLYKLHEILRSYNRRSELERLITWAEQKKFAAPLRLYQNRLLDEEIRLNRYVIRYRTLARLARWIHILNILLFPAPHCYVHGSAASYRYKNLQTL